MQVVPVVAIEIPAEVAPELASAAVRTCNLALGHGRCAQWESSSQPTEAAWLARVGMDPRQPSLFNIELRDAIPHSTRTTYTRALSFVESDAPAQRWSTVGVVVAALVISAESSKRADAAGSGDADATSTAPADVTAPLPTKKTEPPDARLGARRPLEPPPETRRVWRRALRFDVGGEGGTGIEGNRFGALLRPSFELTRDLDVWGQVASSRAKESVTVYWWTFALGLGLRAEALPGWVSVEARLGALANRLDISVLGDSGSSDSATRWRFGGLLGADAVLSLGDSFGWFVGVDGAWTSPQIRVRQQGNEVGQAPNLELLAVTGLRLRFPFGR